MLTNVNLSKVRLTRQNNNNKTPQKINFCGVHVLEIPPKYGIKDLNDYVQFMRNKGGHLQEELLGILNRFRGIVQKATSAEDLAIAPTRCRIYNLYGGCLVVRYTGEDSKNILINRTTMPIQDDLAEFKQQVAEKAKFFIERLGSTFYRVNGTGEIEKVEFPNSNIMLSSDNDEYKEVRKKLEETAQAYNEKRRGKKRFIFF